MIKYLILLALCGCSTIEQPYHKKTIYNLDGTVNTVDFNKLAGNFGQSPRRWAHGNFDYDADVDVVDFNRLASNFGSGGLSPVGDPDDEPTL